ncbi:MAG: FliO/MopB family protein [Amphiplicatus sp.]
MDIIDFSRIFFALIAVIGLIGLCAVIARKAGFASGALSIARRRRLRLVETLPLDARRRAAIICCDGREHLVILGATTETVIETNLPAAAPVVENEKPASPPFAETFARLQKFAARGPRAKREKIAA